jgi:hypothetical protein
MFARKKALADGGFAVRINGRPGTGEASTTLFSNTLQEVRRLSLVEEVDDKLRLTVEARGGGKRGQPSEVYFRAYLSRTLFDSTRAIETGQSAFMVALSWFLSANPLTPMGFADPPQIGLKLEIGDQASKTELISLNRYQNFLYWARYLGFATIVGSRDDVATNSRRAVPDPSRAIAGALASVFSDGGELAIETFLNRLSAIYPVAPFV